MEHGKQQKHVGFAEELWFLGAYDVDTFQG